MYIIHDSTHEHNSWVQDMRALISKFGFRKLWQGANYKYATFICELCDFDLKCHIININIYYIYKYNKLLFLFMSIFLLLKKIQNTQKFINGRYLNFSLSLSFRNTESWFCFPFLNWLAITSEDSNFRMILGLWKKYLSFETYFRMSQSLKGVLFWFCFYFFNCRALNFWDKRGRRVVARTGTKPYPRRETGQTWMDVLGLALIRLATHYIITSPFPFCPSQTYPFPSSSNQWIMSGPE